MKKHRGHIPPPPAVVPEPEVLPYSDDERINRAILSQREFGGEVWIVCRPAHPHRSKSITRFFEIMLRKAKYSEAFIIRFKGAFVEDVPNAMHKAPAGSMVGVTLFSLGQVGHRVCFLIVSNFLYPDGRARFPKPGEVPDPRHDPDATHGYGTLFECELANAFARLNVSNYSTTSALHFLEDDEGCVSK